MTSLFPTPSVVGVDPSITATGLAWPDGRSIAHGEKGITAAAVSYVERGQRLLALARHLRDLALGTGYPHLVVIEGYELHSKASAGLAERCWLWYALVNAFTNQRVPVLVVPPTVLKRYALGKGSGQKNEVIDATARRLPQFDTGGNDNRCDAVWLCAIGCAMLGSPLAELPQAHRAALDSLTLPEGVDAGLTDQLTAEVVG